VNSGTKSPQASAPCVILVTEARGLAPVEFLALEGRSAAALRRTAPQRPHAGGRVGLPQRCRLEVESARGFFCCPGQPPPKPSVLLPEDERELLRRSQPVGMCGAEGRARLLEAQGAEQVLVEEAVLAARLGTTAFPVGP